MDTEEVAEILKHQLGVISRRQVLTSGGCDNDIERHIRRREWARVHPGVFITHTGPLTWDQRAWAAVLFHWPAALAGASALAAHGLRSKVKRSDDAPIEIAVTASRHINHSPLIRVQRITDFDSVVPTNLSPPRVRIEHAVLSVASRAASEDAAVAGLADACQTGRTTASRLVDALPGMPHLRRRGLLRQVLADVAEGAYSALERRYLKSVERPHGLPLATRQRRVSAGRSIAYRDVEYVGLRVIVELDGRLGHETAGERWDDLARDIDALVGGDITLRVGWKQILDPCRLATAVAELLVARGWTGTPRACCDSCPLLGQSNKGGSPAPSARETPLSVQPVNCSNA